MVAGRKTKRAVLVFMGLMAASLAVLPLLPPIPQDQSYHNFADQRTLLGIPNFWNVVSNLPFAIVGAVGLWQFHRDPATVVFFAGVFLTAFGSAYYHWAPSDGTLFSGAGNGLARSSDNGVTWETVNNGVPNNIDYDHADWAGAKLISAA